MEDLTLIGTDHDFAPVHAALRRYVDRDLLAGVSSAVLRGRDLIDLHTTGWADREQQIPMRVDHLFRAFSNTKLITSCAALLLFEEGRLDLDEPVERWLPQLGARQVLKPGATRLDDTEPARSPITARHLLSHSAGLSYGLLDPGTLMFNAYVERKMLDPITTLAQLVDKLADLPLVFHPGAGWEYSVATDVVARLVEVISAESFETFIRRRILDPLGMADTGFVVPAAEQPRLTAYYVGADVLDPMKPGLTRADQLPYPQAYRVPMPMRSGGGGLVSSLPDMIALIRSLMPGGPTLLEPDTLTMMMSNQLPTGQWIRFARMGEVRGKGYGLAGAVTVAPGPIDPPDSAGEFQWGGIGGTHWWISPRLGVAGLVMTQRHMSFWHPFSFEFKMRVCQALNGLRT